MSPVGSSSSSSAFHFPPTGQDVTQVGAREEASSTRPAQVIRAEIATIGPELVNAYEQYGAENQRGSHAPGLVELPNSSLMRSTRHGTTATVSFKDQRSRLDKVWSLRGDSAQIGAIAAKASRYQALQQELRAAEKSEPEEKKRSRQSSPSYPSYPSSPHKRPRWAAAQPAGIPIMLADAAHGARGNTPGITSDLTPTVRAAYEVLRISPEKTEDRLAEVSSLLQMGSKKKLAALALLIAEGEIDLEKLAAPKLPVAEGEIDQETESEQETPVLSELVEYLATSRRPDFSAYREGQEDEGIPTDEERVALLKNVNPFRGRCSNGESPIEFAARKGMTNVVEIFANSPSAEVRNQLRLFKINRNIADTLLSFETFDGVDLYMDDPDEAPFSFSPNFCNGVRSLVDVDRQSWGWGARRNHPRSSKKNIEEAITHFKDAASGNDIPDHASEHKLRIQLESYRHLILIQKNNELKLEPVQQQEELRQSIQDAHCFVNSLQTLPGDQLSRRLVAWVYGAIMEQWKHFPSEEKEKVFLPQILDQMENNDVFLDATNVTFHRAIFDPLVLQGTDTDLKSRVVQRLKNAEAFSATYRPSGDSDYFKLTAAKKFMEKIAVAGWKDTQDEGELKNILSKIPTLVYSDRQETLEYFDLFVHAQAPAAKDDIAKTFVDRAQEVGFQNVLGLGHTISATEASDILLNFAFVRMAVHYLLSSKKETGYLPYSGPSDDEMDRTLDDFLEDIAQGFFACVGAVESRYFDPSDSLSRDANYTERDRMLMTDLAFASISLEAKLISTVALESLKKGEDESACESIDSWSRAARRRIALNVRGETSSQSEEYRALRQRLAEHSRNEFARTESRA